MANSRQYIVNNENEAFLQTFNLLAFKNSKCFNESQFRTFFGVGPQACETIWNLICQTNQYVTIKPRHLLYGLLFLKVYSTEEVHSGIFNVTTKTFRSHSWEAVRFIADLKMVSYSTKLYHFNSIFSLKKLTFFYVSFQLKWENRRTIQSRNVSISVDGTDCRICEPSPFSSKWYSHKFNGPGLRYEVAVSISTGHLVWAYGPFPCGSHPDISIFKLRLAEKLDPFRTQNPSQY